jgi:hypothetical protein
MPTDHIDFWFTMGSTYSYLSVMRLTELQQSSGVQFRWRPFHLLTILQEMKHVPFADKPAKLAYMWRDIERRAAMYGIPASLPAPYPAKNSMLANLVALVGMRQGWVSILLRLPIVVGSSLAKRQVASPMFRKACAKLDRSRRRCSLKQTQTRLKPPWSQRLTLQKSFASSDHRRSRSEASFSEATTALRTRLVGTRAVACGIPAELFSLQARSRSC